jgi:hypothetical protein
MHIPLSPDLLHADAPVITTNAAAPGSAPSQCTTIPAASPIIVAMEISSAAAVPDSTSARHAVVGSTPVGPDVGASAPSSLEQAPNEPVPDLSCDDGSFGADSVSVSAAPTAVTPTDTTPTTHRYGTRFKHNIRQPKVCTDGMVTYSAVKTSSEPTSYTIAIKDPLWCQAMNDEFRALLKNKTWHLISPRAGLNIIDCKWVFKLKHKPDGSIDHHKALLVAKGFKQQYGVDYDDTFSTVIKPTTIRVLLSLMVGQYGKLIFKMPFFTAFLMKMFI